MQVSRIIGLFTLLFSFSTFLSYGQNFNENTLQEAQLNLTYSEIMTDYEGTNLFQQDIYSWDVNQDGLKDVVWANLIEGEIGWFENLGDFVFSDFIVLKSDFTFKFINRPILFGDFENNQFLDIVYVNDLGEINHLKQNSDFTFSEYLISNFSSDIEDINWADLDNDGDQDLAIFSSDTLILKELNGTSFTNHLISFSNSNFNQEPKIHFIHLDQNEQLDMVIEFGNNYNSIILNNGGFIFENITQSFIDQENISDYAFKFLVGNAFQNLKFEGELYTLVNQSAGGVDGGYQFGIGSVTIHPNSSFANFSNTFNTEYYCGGYEGFFQNGSFSNLNNFIFIGRNWEDEQIGGNEPANVFTYTEQGTFTNLDFIYCNVSTIGTGTFLRYLALSDFDDDGDKDAIVTFPTNEILVFENLFYNCSSDAFLSPPNEQEETIDEIEVKLTWEEYEGANKCLVSGNKNSIAEDLNFFVDVNSTVPDSFNKTFNSQNFEAGELYRWRVKCGCTTAGLFASPYSDYQYFTFPVFISENETKSLSNSLEGPILEIYPNPVSDILRVNLEAIPPTKLNLEFQILNQLGQLVFSKKMKDYSEIEVLELSHLERGMYFLQLRNTERILEVKKFVKE